MKAGPNATPRGRALKIARAGASLTADLARRAIARRRKRVGAGAFVRSGSPEVQEAFLRGLRLANQVFKFTHTGRLDDTLGFVLEHVTSIPDRPLRVLDVACSSGITTIELHQALETAGIGCSTTGTDLVTSVDAVIRERDEAVIVFDKDRRIIQVEIEDDAVTWPLRWPDAIKPVLAMRASRMVRDHERRFRAALEQATAGYRVVEVSLLTPLRESVPGVSFRGEDLFAPTPDGGYQLVRAANILSRFYFDDVTLRILAARLLGRVVEGGYLFVLRTEGSTNIGAMFRREGGRARLVGTIGGGEAYPELFDGLEATDLEG